MQTKSLILIPSTDYEHVSGNYDGSSNNFCGDPQKAAGYNSSVGDLQTVSFFTQGLGATITIQATLDTNPVDASCLDESSWFDVYTFTGNKGVETAPDGSVSGDDSSIGNGNPDGGVAPMAGGAVQQPSNPTQGGGVANPIANPGDGSTIDGSTEFEDQNEAHNILGRFCWIRAKVDNYTQGTIHKVILSY